MNHIKYRAWHNHDQKMQTDDFIAMDMDGEISEVDLGLGCVWQGTYYCEGKYTIMQYTGVKDKNGTEIYEGDIVTLPTIRKKLSHRLIQFEKGTFHFGYVRDGMCDHMDMEVIGNRYEHPELLEEVRT